jgi:hypothetical protein
MQPTVVVELDELTCSTIVHVGLTLQQLVANTSDCGSRLSMAQVRLAMRFWGARSFFYYCDLFWPVLQCVDSILSLRLKRRTYHAV